MVVVDSSGWIEFFTDGPKANVYERYLRKPQKIVTPMVVVCEVYKKIKRERGEDLAKLCVAQIDKTRGQFDWTNGTLLPTSPSASNDRTAARRSSEAFVCLTFDITDRHP